MRFRDHRPVLLKGIDIPDLPKLDTPNTPAMLTTPRFISPTASGRLAAQMADKKPPLTLPNRAYVRNAMPSNRPRLSGVALSPREMPWKV